MVEQVKQGDILGATVIVVFGLISFVVGHVAMNPEPLRRLMGLCLFAVLLSGCASADATRPKPSFMPTATEAGAITEVTVASLLPEGSLTDIDQQRLAQYLTDARAILLGILDQEAQTSRRLPSPRTKAST